MNPKVQVDWDQEEPFPSPHKVEGEKKFYLFLIKQDIGFLQ